MAGVLPPNRREGKYSWPLANASIKVNAMANAFETITFDTKPADFPLREGIGLRGRIATFESQFKDGFGDADTTDVEFLMKLSLGKCRGSACDCAIYPFIYKPGAPHRSLPSCFTILDSLGVKAFNSKHRYNFAECRVELEENHRGTQSDEIHTDPEDQFIFSMDWEDPDSAKTHNLLKNYTLEHHLYYVLLHTKPHPYEQFMFSDWVILFALGVSPQSGNLVGVVTHQACHNLCD